MVSYRIASYHILYRILYHIISHHILSYRIISDVSSEPCKRSISPLVSLTKSPVFSACREQNTAETKSCVTISSKPEKGEDFMMKNQEAIYVDGVFDGAEYKM